MPVAQRARAANTFGRSNQTTNPVVTDMAPFRRNTPKRRTQSRRVKRWAATWTSRSTPACLSR